MTDLVEFLRARVLEDEQAARAADGVTWKATKGLHDFSDGGGLAEMVTLSDAEGTPIVTDLNGEFTADDLVHIARHDPARVLREVEARRRIVDRAMLLAKQAPAADNIRALDTATGAVSALGEVLRDLASVYADHPDYRQEWRP